MNNRLAASLFHTTTEPESLPVNSPIGTVVVVTVPCSDHASRARSQTCAPSSTVTDPEAACAIGYQRSGFASTTGLVARCINADMNWRWLIIRSRSARGVARVRT